MWKGARKWGPGDSASRSLGGGPMGELSQLDIAQLKDDEGHSRRVLRRCCDLLRSRSLLQKIELRVACHSWNVAESAPIADMGEWLRCGEAQGADVIAVSLQEVDMSVGALATEKTQKGMVWLQNVHEQLGGPLKYQALEPAQLVGLVMMVFVKSELHPECRQIRGDVVKLGGHGLTGNKGGIAVRLLLRGRRLCFVGSHLAADMKHYDKRNDNYHTLIKEIGFDVTATMPETTLPHFADHPMPRYIDTAPERRKLRVLNDDHDYVFWMGDLNYRLDDIGEAEAKQLVQEERWEDLLTYDQLVRAMKSGDAFSDFREAEIHWAPTYKYEIGTHDYTETKGDEAKHGKMRVPAYCDRVLYFVADRAGNRVDVAAYRRFEYTVSDHRPVSLLVSLEAEHVPDRSAAQIETGSCLDWADRLERRDACVRRVNRYLGEEHEALIDDSEPRESFKMRLQSDIDPTWWHPLAARRGEP